VQMVFLSWVNELMAPCFDPCRDCQPQGKVQRPSAALRTLRTPGHAVELAVSPLAGLRGFAGYHTSVLVAGEEYYFCPSGICCSAKIVSHQDGASMRRIYIGLSQVSGCELLDFLTEHFRQGTYDLLLKNCNSFSDCALYFLCEQRLDLRYRTVEKLAWVADDNLGLLHSITSGEYKPNPRAGDFDSQAVLRAMDAARYSDCSDSDGDANDELVFEDSGASENVFANVRWLPPGEKAAVGPAPPQLGHPQFMAAHCAPPRTMAMGAATPLFEPTRTLHRSVPAVVAFPGIIAR
ncbi:unnamed protein product, partial [Polarella glacialis]